MAASRLSARLPRCFALSFGQARRTSSASRAAGRRTDIAHKAWTPSGRVQQQWRCFHLSVTCRDLMEFFDDEKNWGANEVRVGRAWRREELRIKSSEDLHKLWYVLLKERNMLMTMEHYYKSECRLFANPERIDKVEESMQNLEEVIRERDRAYFELETGETGERRKVTRENILGLEETKHTTEHVEPKDGNVGDFELEPGEWKDVRTFKLMYREKEYLKEKKARNRDFRLVAQLLKRFPDMDMEALQQAYPEVDIERAKKSKKALGHRDNS